MTFRLFKRVGEWISGSSQMSFLPNFKLCCVFSSPFSGSRFLSLRFNHSVAEDVLVSTLEIFLKCCVEILRTHVPNFLLF